MPFTVLPTRSQRYEILAIVSSKIFGVCGWLVDNGLTIGWDIDWQLVDNRLTIGILDGQN